jgi:DNA mismatch repair ATPase MutS
MRPEGYLARLIKAGCRVAIAEQVETPEEAKKRGGSKALVKRDIVRFVTAGTLTEEACWNRAAPMCWRRCELRRDRHCGLRYFDRADGAGECVPTGWARLWPGWGPANWWRPTAGASAVRPIPREA